MSGSLKDEKVVLITGAGFSAKADLPVQSLVLGSLFRFSPNVGHIGRGDYSMSIALIKGFLNAVFLNRGRSMEIAEEDRPVIEGLTLEDVYTVLDKAVVRRDWLAHYDWIKLVEVRRALDLCVLVFLTAKQEEYKGNDYYRLAQRLNKTYDDAWSTITLNWDTIWDKTLGKALEPGHKIIDYGCAHYWLIGDEYRLEPHSKLALGTTLLKLHGSFNWLSCPRCRTLFVSQTDIGKLGYLDLFVCPRCAVNGADPFGPMLQPLFLSPTILKTFDSPSLNTIWDNAIHTISEASRIIFVGYSFPLADHDLRFLLRKAVRKNTRIDVVLTQSSNPRPLKPDIVKHTPYSRFKSFFNLGDEAFHFDGWEDFFNRLLGS